MFDNYQPPMKRLTVDDVYEMLEDRVRHQMGHEYVAAYPLHGGTSVLEWQLDSGLPRMPEMVGALNADWCMDTSAAEWQRLLEPDNERTLDSVCEFIAERARVPAVEPITVFGKSCRLAGAFLTIRSLLKQAGADVSSLRPSTPIARLARQYPDVFTDRISSLAPHMLPTVRRLERGGLSLLSLITGLMLFVAACCVPSLTQLVWSCSCPLIAIGAIGAAATLNAGPLSMTFGQIRTFRDLSITIAAACQENERRSTRVPASR